MCWLLLVLLLFPTSGYSFPLTEVRSQYEAAESEIISKSFSHLVFMPTRFSQLFLHEKEELFFFYSQLFHSCFSTLSPMLEVITDGLLWIGEQLIVCEYVDQEDLFRPLICFFLFLDELKQNEKHLDSEVRTFLRAFEDLLSCEDLLSIFYHSFELGNSHSLVVPAILPEFSMLKKRAAKDVASESLALCSLNSARFITGLEPFLISGALAFLKEALRPFLTCAVLAIGFYWGRHEIFSFFQKPLKRKLKQLKKQHKENIEIIEKIADQRLRKLIEEIHALENNVKMQGENVSKLRSYQKASELFVHKQLLKTSSFLRSLNKISTFLNELKVYNEEGNA